MARGAMAPRLILRQSTRQSKQRTRRVGERCGFPQARMLPTPSISGAMSSFYSDMGATILAASGSNYDPAEPNKPWEDYQDYGHNHWHNSLIWGEGIHDIAIIGLWSDMGQRPEPGRLGGTKRAETPGNGNKAISSQELPQRAVTGFLPILKGGHFGVLATGVDNMTVDNLGRSTPTAMAWISIAATTFGFRTAVSILPGMMAFARKARLRLAMHELRRT